MSIQMISEYLYYTVCVCVCVCGPLVCVCSDGKTLAAGGRSNLLHLWCLESRQLLRVVQMPPKVRTVRQLEFLHDSLDGGTSQVLGRIRGTSRSSDMCDNDVWRDIRRLLIFLCLFTLYCC